MASAKTQKILRYILMGIGISLLVGFLFYYFVIDTIQINNQKKDFDKAEANINSLAAQIQQTIGKADETKTEKSCDRPNLKYATGKLSCSISLSLPYVGAGLSGSNRYLKLSSTLFKSPLRVGSGATRGQEFVNKEGVNGVQTFLQDINKVGGISCSIDYSYPSHLGTGGFTKTDEDFVLEVICSGPAKKEFYPAKD